MNDSLVVVRELTRRFDVSGSWLDRLLKQTSKRWLTAAEAVSFEIEQGSTFALVGESGSGKSTIAKMLAGLLEPSSGSYRIGGTDPRDASDDERRELRRRIQMIFQSPYASLNPRWRVRDIVAEPLDVFELADDANERTRRVDELLEQVGLSSSDAARYPHEFSGGQRQRIGVARALASNPEFVICDEPTSALDVSVQAQVLNLMRDLQKELGLTYLFITHDLSVVRYMATHVGVLYLGRLVEVAERETLFAAPAHPYTKMLLEAAPRLDGFDREAAEVGGEIPDPINRPAGCHFHPRCPYREGHCDERYPDVRTVDGHRVACFETERVLAGETP